MKNVVVTGASRGIGRAIAIRLGRENYRVMINYLNSENDAIKTLKIIENSGGKGVLARADVSKYEEIKAKIEDFCEKYGQIYAMVLNAGIYIRKNVEEMSVEDWDDTISINLSGAFYPIKAALNCIENGGSIVFIASQLAFRGSGSSVAYGASKAGILGLMRSLALQLSNRKIRVNAISPGTVDTDIISNYTQEMRRRRAEEIPLGRIGKPEDIAGVVSFLLSEDSRYITGANIDVNGGLYIH